MPRKPLRVAKWTLPSRSRITTTPQLVNVDRMI